MARDPRVEAPVPTAERERSARLRVRLRAAVGPEGTVPFDRFIEIVLYDPTDGYYAQPEFEVGPAGDFYTASKVHRLFGWSLAARIRSEYERLGSPSSFRVVEVGPGDGTLATQLVERLHQILPTDAIIDYVLIDVSPVRLQRLAETVGSAAGPRIIVRWGSSLSADGPFQGVVIANELLDAMPFRRVVRRGTRWRELGVMVRDGSMEWTEGELVRPVLTPPLPEAPEGTVLEISESAEGWVRELADQLIDGAALIIDYGANQDALAARGPGGTIATVRGHRSTADPFQDPGTFDISAFVNFTRIREAAARAGLRELAFRRQPESLGEWGFEALLAEELRSASSSEESVRTRLAAKNLLFGFGTFWVLELTSGKSSTLGDRAKLAGADPLGHAGRNQQFSGLLG